MKHGRFVRTIIKDGVRRELKKRYPDTYLKFSTRVDRKDRTVIYITAKPIDDRTSPYYMECKLYTSGITTFEQLIDRLVAKVDWFDDYQDYI